MTLIVCLDKRNGMRFNNRRQSCDRCVTERIIRMSQGGKLYISQISESLFPGVDRVVSESVPEPADSKDVYFFEAGDVFAYLEKTERLIVFRWDKVYPADTKFPMDSCAKEFTLKSTETFSGYSHDLITQEVYAR